MTPKTYTIVLTAEQAQVVYAGLGELPTKISLSTLDEFRQQVAIQDQMAHMNGALNPVDVAVPKEGE